ncbi:hypothetical protein P0Y35_09645 [Kiritimatiellaeota bacterium B1221]|nr:hypothetical protein [Kiritimatiellaeota bacterium B1221]
MRTDLIWQRVCELLHGQLARCDWEAGLGSSLGGVGPYLKESDQLANVVRVQGCDWPHEIVEKNGRYWGVCKGGKPEDCPDLEFKDPSDIRVLEFNSRRLAETVAASVPIQPDVHDIDGGLLWHLGVGSWRNRDGEVSIYLCFSAAGGVVRQAALRVAKRESRDCLFISCMPVDGGIVECLPGDSEHIRLWDFYRMDGGESAVARKLLYGWPNDKTRNQIGAGKVTDSQKSIAEADGERCEEEAPEFSYRKSGAVWEVIYEGSTPFHIKDSMGSKYVDWLLHHPGKTIPCLELEQMIQKEKEGLRSGYNRDTNMDGAGKSGVRKRLRELTMERAKLESEGREAELKELDAEVQEIENALKGANRSNDDGNRARDSVRKAIDRLYKNLNKTGAIEKSFSSYLKSKINAGYDIMFIRDSKVTWK